MISSFRALRQRPFALLWSGQTISSLGDRFYQVALAWWVLEKTGSAVVMGTVLICSDVPMLVFLLLGGALVDRWPRLPVMMLSDLVRGLAVGLMAALAFINALQVWHIYVISLIFGSVDAFFQPAYRASVPEIVPVDHLPSANSLTSLSGEISGIIGPALGAGMVALGGTSSAFALDALSFFVSVACLLPILRLSVSPRAEEPSESIMKDVRARAGNCIWDAVAVDHDCRSRDFQHHLCWPDGCRSSVFDQRPPARASWCAGSFLHLSISGRGADCILAGAIYAHSKTRHQNVRCLDVDRDHGCTHRATNFDPRGAGSCVRYRSSQHCPQFDLG